MNLKVPPQRARSKFVWYTKGPSSRMRNKFPQLLKWRGSGVIFGENPPCFWLHFFFRSHIGALSPVNYIAQWKQLRDIQSTIFEDWFRETKLKRRKSRNASSFSFLWCVCVLRDCVSRGKSKHWSKHRQSFRILGCLWSKPSLPKSVPKSLPVKCELSSALPLTKFCLM